MILIPDNWKHISYNLILDQFIQVTFLKAGKYNNFVVFIIKIYINQFLYFS